MKSDVVQVDSPVDEVAPCAGAWIEILPIWVTGQSLRCRPLRGGVD